MGSGVAETFVRSFLLNGRRPRKTSLSREHRCQRRVQQSHASFMQLNWEYEFKGKKCFPDGRRRG